MEQAQSLIAQLTAMLDRDFGAGDSAPASKECADRQAVPASDDQVQGFCDALGAKLAAILDADERLWRGEVVNSDTFAQLVDEVAALCKPMGFEGLARAARDLIDANGNSIKFRQGKFRLYEELAAIAELRPKCADRLPIRPLVDLQTWCAKSASKILLDMRSALDWMRVGAPERREFDHRLTAVGLSRVRPSQAGNGWSTVDGAARLVRACRNRGQSV